MILAVLSAVIVLRDEWNRITVLILAERESVIMLTMAVADKAETYQRMSRPLRERGIEVAHVDLQGKAIEIGDEPRSLCDHTYDLGYVYPRRLMEGAVLDELLDIDWVNSRRGVLMSRNKAAVYTLAAKSGIDIPQTMMISNPADESTLETVYEHFDGPIVVKPNSTTKGKGIAKVTDLDSFLAVVDYLRLIHDFGPARDKSFLVQEFIPRARDIRILTIDGTYVGAVERRRPPGESMDRWKKNVHQGANAHGLTVDDSLKELAERVANLLSVPILGIDLLLTDAEAYLLETNARPTIDDASKYEDGFWDTLAAAIRKRA